MTVDQLLAQISSRELTEWMAYALVEPWGEERADFRAGVVASVTANAYRDPKKRRTPYEPKDFMPSFARKQPQGWEQQLQIVKLLNVAMGGKDLRAANASLITE